MFIKIKVYKYTRVRESDPFYQTTFWKSLRLLCLERDKYLCLKCKDKGKLNPGKVADHIIPRKKGGKDELSNLQTLCERCHAVKSAKDK